MFCSLSNGAPAVVACAALVLNGCGGRSNPGSLSAMVKSGHTAHRSRDIQSAARPVRRCESAFPAGNPAQRRYPAWPASYDASFRVSWRQLRPTDPRTLPLDAPDDRKFDFSVIDDALTKLASRLRLTLRVYAYNCGWGKGGLNLRESVVGRKGCRRGY
jgi:hypothetical protein